MNARIDIHRDGQIGAGGKFTVFVEKGIRKKSDFEFVSGGDKGSERCEASTGQGGWMGQII
jgi:hypothetical protein